MVSIDGLGVDAIALDYPWSTHDRIVDVGGGMGQVSAAILARHDRPTALVVDLPAVVADGAQAFSARHPLLAGSGRVAFEAGSFLNASSFPPLRDGDVLLLRNILHDWTDVDAVRILRVLRVSGHMCAGRGTIVVGAACAWLQHAVFLPQHRKPLALKT
jgi:SAM-dependent methyltransferase